MKQAKRILKIELQRIDDPDPDTSYLGTFSSHPDTQFAIDHRERLAHSPRLGLQSPTQTLQWFNPATVEDFNSNATWIPATVENKRQYWHDAMTKNAQRDYRRMRAFLREAFGYIGIRASAEIVIESTCQTIRSGGLWGIESDSNKGYLSSIEQEQLSELRGILHELGFSRRAIATAVKTIER